MNAAAQRRLTPLLGGAAVVAGALLLAMLAGVGRNVAWGPPRPAVPLPATHDQGLPAPRPLDAFAVVWTQPLFSPDRQPALHAASGGASLGDLSLTGIILTPHLHLALLREKEGEHEVRVREGAALPDGSWTLAELKPRSAVFASASGRTELVLPAGAPIDAPKADSAAAEPALPPPVAVPLVVPGPPPAGHVPANAAAAAQADRIRQLQEAIQKRRAQQAAAPQGAH
jgi:general secretion pathway protein N